MKGFDVPKEHALQPHLQNQMEKCLPAPLNSSFYSGKRSLAYPGYYGEGPVLLELAVNVGFLCRQLRRKANVCSLLLLLSRTL